MLGNTVSNAIAINKANVGISIENTSHAARSAADIGMRKTPLGGTLRSVITSRQVVHKVRTCVIYRAVLSVHLQLYVGFWAVIANRSLKLELVAFLAVFSAIITTASAHDNAPYSTTPVKPNVLQIGPSPSYWGLPWPPAHG
jgi:cation transport ATPase